MRLEPLENELLSCWLVRTAHAHRIDAATFINLHFPRLKNILWTRDLDISADQDLLNTLSFKSGLPFETLYGLTLKSYEGYLAEQITTHSINHFIQPLGNYGRIKTKHGLRFCPICLSEDKVPYFRKKWRLSFSTVCIKHSCYLLDRCPKCGSSVTLYKSFFDFGFLQCFKCGKDYSKIEPVYVDAASPGLKAVAQLYEILDSGTYTFGVRQSYSFLFFEVFHQVLRIVCYWRMNKSFPTFMESSCVKRRDILKHDRYFLDYHLKSQYCIVSGVMALFDVYPDSLIDYFKLNGLRKTDLIKDLRYVPYFFSNIVDRFDLVERMVTADEVKGAITYLKNKKAKVYKQWVAELMGVSLDLRKRKDIKKLFRKHGRFYLAV